MAKHPRVDHPPLDPPATGLHLESADGLELYLWLREPATAPRGVIDLVLGPEIGSAEPYPRLCAAALAAGYALAAVHPRGCGYSPGIRGDVDDYALILD
ncbi:MAG: hypothetical protein KC457_18435, partial [Myxococcales bacterium]|nr:hypothetical protein [Myxococcales bacterium]